MNIKVNLCFREKNINIQLTAQDTFKDLTCNVKKKKKIIKFLNRKFNNLAILWFLDKNN